MRHLKTKVLERRAAAGGVLRDGTPPKTHPRLSLTIGQALRHLRRRPLADDVLGVNNQPDSIRSKCSLTPLFEKR
jgi:hypothetical protein